MAVELRDAHLDERDRLRQLLADYLFEFDGRTEPYPYLDAYWEEPERLPLLIEADGDVVGLCLVRRRSDGWSIAEFFVLPDRRLGGVGRAAVEALVARAGAAGADYLEAKVHQHNPYGLPFWHAVGFSEVEGPGTGVTVTRRTLSPSSRPASGEVTGGRERPSSSGPNSREPAGA